MTFTQNSNINKKIFIEFEWNSGGTKQGRKEGIEEF